MNRWVRILAPLSLGVAVSGCSLGGLLGGGAKPPPTLLTLTAEAPDPGQISRSANAGQAVTISVPTVPKEIRTVRVPVQLTPTDVQYVTNLQWVDTPDRLFADLVGETVRRMLAGEPNVEYRFCPDPACAIDAANEFQPTVILQDLVMPEIDEDDDRGWRAPWTAAVRRTTFEWQEYVAARRDLLRIASATSTESSFKGVEATLYRKAGAADE